MAAEAWDVGEVAGPAAALHQRSVAPVRPAVTRVRATERALVLGSTQSVDDVDASALEHAGVALARRRSGGGAVLVAPEEPLWVDVVVPVEHGWWRADVGRAAVEVGRRWAAALVACGVDATVHDGRYERRAIGQVVCFGGLGPGEVLDADGRKLVGVAQRRVREGAWFQCAVHRVWDPEPTLALLHPDRRPGRDVLAAGAGVAPDELFAAFVDAASR